MIIVEGAARISDEVWETAQDAMAKMVIATRAEPGCIDYSFSRDLADPSVFRFLELWEDKAALVNHFTQPHSLVFAEVLKKASPEHLHMRTYESEPTDFPS